MVTFYRKAQINGQSSSLAGIIDSTANAQASRVNGTEYVSVISAEDDLPYVMVRPKVNRKNNKKVLRMRSNWD